MFKKFTKPIALILLILLVFGVTGCGKEEKKSGEVTPTPQPEGPAFKIGIMTGTTSQGEEEFMMAKRLQDKYGDMIVHTTYPDNFASEQETTITNLATLAADPDVKALVVCQAVIGSAAAVDRVKETRPEMLIIFGGSAEHPEMISPKVDFVIGTDAFKRGISIIEQAKKLGAENFVHYSFARHLSMEGISSRLKIMKETAAELGINFIELDAPDPTGDAGVTGAQQFIMEDVPRVVKQYGKNTAIFATNCSMQEPLIKQTIANGSIYPVQCCPSPYHALPGALGIAVPEEKKGDVAWILQEIDKAIIEKGAAGRISTWPVPVNMASIEAGTEYAIKYLKGEIKERFDKDAIKDILEEVAGVEITLTPWPLADGRVLDNYLMYHADYVTFGVGEVKYVDK